MTLRALQFLANIGLIGVMDQFHGQALLVEFAGAKFGQDVAKARAQTLAKRAELSGQNRLKLREVLSQRFDVLRKVARNPQALAAPRLNELGKRRGDRLAKRRILRVDRRVLGA